MKKSFKSASTSTSGSSNQDKIQKFAEAITEKLIAGLEKGNLPWRKPWAAGQFQNITTGTIYSGLNPLWLTIHNMAGGFSCPFFASFNQITELGGVVLKGAKGAHIGFNAPVESDKKDPTTGKVMLNANGEKLKNTYWCFKTYVLFNIEQTGSGSDPNYLTKVRAIMAEKIKERENPIIKNAEEGLNDYISRENISFAFGGNRAYYSPSKDHVQMPERKHFVDSESFYHVLSHEVGHSTGHKDRMNRDGFQGGMVFKGDETYSVEELIAEIFASISAGYFGFCIPALEDNSQAYINGWVKELKNHPKMIFDAATAAKKAFQFMLEGKKEKVAVTA